MGGFNLSEGQLNKIEINIENLFDLFIDGKKTNTYKFFLFETLIELANEHTTVTTISKVIKKMIKNYWNFFALKSNFYAKEETESLLYKDLVEHKFIKYEDLSKNLKEIIINKNLKTLKNYVFGALYKDMEGKLYGFSKRNDFLEINDSFVTYFKNDTLSKNYIYKIKNELNEFLSKRNTFDIIKRRKEMAYYQQKFSFEMTFVYKILNNIEKLRGSKFEMAQELGLGTPKLDALLQYLKISDLISQDNELTLLGSKILKMKLNADYIEPLILYNLIKNPEKGGHYVYSNFINDVLYDYSVVNFTDEITKKELVEKSKENNILNLGKWNDMIGYVYKSLTDSESGFGKMGILEKTHKTGKDEIVEVHSYWIEPLVGAYIIYDMWKDGQTAMEISNIINEKYNLGRMFLMDADAVEETLLEIQSLRLIEIEKRSGLNQIRIKPNITKEDILNRIIDEA